jgi:hypothetical protein
MAEIKAGDRIELVSTSDQITKLVPGDQGVVTFVADLSGVGLQISIEWDSGSSLTMLPDTGDRVRLVTT